MVLSRAVFLRFSDQPGTGWEVYLEGTGRWKGLSLG